MSLCTVGCKTNKCVPCMQVRRREEAADHASADMARKIAALDQKDRSAAEKEQSLSSLTAELWAKVTSFLLPPPLPPPGPPSPACPPPHIGLAQVTAWETRGIILSLFIFSLSLFFSLVSLLRQLSVFTSILCGGKLRLRRCFMPRLWLFAACGLLLCTDSISV